MIWSVAAAAVLGSACGSSTSDGTDANSPASFVAHDADFAGFRGWSSAPASAPNGVSDGLHVPGPLTVYWNRNPPHGATTFPVGTIIVKETNETDLTQRSVFAMVKRGGGFNEIVAGWEWFSLADAPDGTATILWGDVTPPAGETYAGQPIGDCNGCHVAASNDGVWDSALQLSKF